MIVGTSVGHRACGLYWTALVAYFAALFFSLSSPRSAQADIIAYWNFNTLSVTGGVPSNANQTLYAPTSGAGSLSLIGWSSRGGGTAPHGISNSTGSLLNAIGADPAGRSLMLEASNASSGTPNNGASLVIQANLTSYIDPVITFASIRNGPGFKSNQVAWSLDGVNFTNFGSAYSPGTSYAVDTFDFSAVNALDGAAAAYFRITFGGATQASSYNRLDNFRLSAIAIPEPGLCELLVAASFCGYLYLLRRHTRRLAAD